jgi:hypothetical protein
MATKQTPNCSHPSGCTARAVGFIPGDDIDELYCGDHFDEKQLAGFFGVLLGHVVCPECKGRAGYIPSVTCKRCGKVGAVPAVTVAELTAPEEWACCKKCNGTGRRRPRPGRPGVNRTLLARAA